MTWLWQCKQAGLSQRTEELGTREDELGMCGEGDVILLFLASMFLSTILEQPKGGGLAGWVSHVFWVFDGTQWDECLSRFSEQLGWGHLGWWRKGTCSPVEKTGNGFHVTPRVALSVVGRSLIGWFQYWNSFLWRCWARQVVIAAARKSGGC